MKIRYEVDPIDVPFFADVDAEVVDVDRVRVKVLKFGRTNSVIVSRAAVAGVIEILRAALADANALANAPELEL